MRIDADRNSRFQQVWDEHRSQVLAYCLRRIPPSEAEDACAEVFLVVWRRLDDVPPPPGTIIYLYGIAARVLSHSTRSRSRRSRLDVKLSNLGVAPPPDPGILVVQGAEDRIVAEAVRNLRPKDREIVMLYAWEELSREEIAEVMGMTKPAVDQRIHRAYRRLARVLRPTLDIPEREMGKDDTDV